MDDVKRYCTTWDEQAIYDLKTVVSSEAYDAALAREAALRVELTKANESTRKCIESADRQHLRAVNAGRERDALQQRLTVAEQRAGKMEDLLREAYEEGDHNIFGTDLDSRIEAALKPATEGEGS